MRPFLKRNHFGWFKKTLLLFQIWNLSWLILKLWVGNGFMSLPPNYSLKPRSRWSLSMRNVVWHCEKEQDETRWLDIDKLTFLYREVTFGFIGHVISQVTMLELWNAAASKSLRLRAATFARVWMEVNGVKSAVWPWLKSTSQRPNSLLENGKRQELIGFLDTGILPKKSDIHCSPRVTEYYKNCITSLFQTWKVRELLIFVVQVMEYQQFFLSF